MKKILAFSFFPAFVPPRSGGELRLFHIYRQLSESFRVVLLSSSHVNVEVETIVHGRNFVERRIPKDDHFLKHWSQLSSIAGEGDLSAVCIAAAGKDPTPLHAAYLEEYSDADVIIHDSPFTVDYDLFLGLDSRLRVYNSYNCESELYRQFHPEERSKPILDLIVRCERKLLEHSDVVTHCSEPDRLAFESLLGRPISCGLHLPNGLTPHPPGARPKTNNKAVRAVFTGSAHMPNVAAAQYIIEELAPRVPNVEFHILGGCWAAGRHGRNVVSHGLVSAKDKDDILLASDIGLNPMLAGGGSNLKVLEFFSIGLPVLSTPFGMRGFEVVPGEHCIVAELDHFEGALKSAASRLPELMEVGARGRDFIARRYSWESICKRLEKILMTTTRPSNRPLDAQFVLGLNDYDPSAASGGGAVRLQGLYETVARATPVVYLCFSNTSSIEIEIASNQWVLIKIPKSEAHLRAEKFYNERFYVSTSDIVAIKHAVLNPILELAYAVLRRLATTIVTDHPYMVALPTAFGDRFVYSSQNNETQLKESLLRYHPDRELLLAAVRQAETIAVESARCVIAVSEEDAQTLVASRNCAAPVLVVRNGAHPPSAITPQDEATARAAVGERAVVFMGSAHVPNVEAAKFIAGRLAMECPGIQFHLLGSVCDSVAAPLPQNLRVWGTVSESLKAAIMASCSAAINPMFSGSGSNVKLADFIGNGLHVVTTEFGRRGYPSSIDSHVSVATADTFASVLTQVLATGDLNAPEQRSQRFAVFEASLAMRSLAQGFADCLLDLRTKKHRVLFVTYRYLWPTVGGAEEMLSKLLNALARSGHFEIDVVAADVAQIEDDQRFSARYSSRPDLGAAIGLPGVRYQRFNVRPQPHVDRFEGAREIWSAQPAFDRRAYHELRASVSQSGLAWGWGSVEGSDGNIVRWSYNDFGIHLAEHSQVELALHSPQAGALLVLDGNGHLLAHVELSAQMHLCLEASAGAINFQVSAPCTLAGDARPLGVLLQSMKINGALQDLSRPLVDSSATVAAPDRFHALANAADHARAHLRLTDLRGPHVPELEAFLAAQVSQYDMVLTHNCVFRTAAVAIKAASDAQVPSVMIPHAHLDDDFYHFPDVLESVTEATEVLAAPQAACDFYRSRGARSVTYLPAGIDTAEVFSDADEAAFRALFPDDVPFLLVLGRKALAKGYRSVIEATQSVAARQPIHMVMIGPDDDGLAVAGDHVTYLGRQPREVVRGALRACTVLVNMSSSESFGIVLLEAWMAGRPVIANRACAAFADLAVDGENALLVGEQELAAAIERLLMQPGLAATLATAGRATAVQYDWDSIGRKFVDVCLSVCAKATSDNSPTVSRLSSATT
ncbi:MAG: glycosyltransferase [Burkholderiales bacterium]|nr:glycosyltransferase [Burkholderiales bacterium]